MSATILNHPRHEVKLQDPRELLPVPERVLDAYRDNCAQRAALNIPLLPPPDEAQWQRLEGFDAVYRLVQLHGADRVQRWVRMAAQIEGQDIETDRPADRCLADGAALHNFVCVQCGRDNS